MSRRADPQRIDVARKAATRRRLSLDGVTEEAADAWIAAWHAQAARNGLPRDAGYWTAAWEWIAAERQRRARP